jgi:hypothetical protein
MKDEINIGRLVFQGFKPFYVPYPFYLAVGSVLSRFKNSSYFLLLIDVGINMGFCLFTGPILVHYNKESGIVSMVKITDACWARRSWRKRNNFPEVSKIVQFEDDFSSVNKRDRITHNCEIIRIPENIMLLELI